MKKIFLFFSFFILINLFFSFPAFVQGVAYPAVPEATPPTAETKLPDYVRYLFNFFIWISGFIALGVLIYGGFRYLTSAGNVEVLKDARDRIFAAFSGLIILFGSYLILTAINPQLRIIQPTPPDIIYLGELPPGVLLCKEETAEVGQVWSKILTLKRIPTEDPDREQLIQEVKALLNEISKKCSLARTGNIAKGLAGKVKYVFFIPSLITGEDYGAAFFAKENYQGEAVSYWHHLLPGKMLAPVMKEVGSLNPYSLVVYKLNPTPNPDRGVTLYEHVNFNKDAEGWKNFYPIGKDSYFRGPITTWPPKSIRIDPGFIAILRAEIPSSNLEDKLCNDEREGELVFTADHGNLLELDEISLCVNCWWWKGTKCREPVATKLEILSASIY